MEGWEKHSHIVPHSVRSTLLPLSPFLALASMDPFTRRHTLRTHFQARWSAAEPPKRNLDGSKQLLVAIHIDPPTYLSSQGNHRMTRTLALDRTNPVTQRCCRYRPGSEDSTG